MLKPLIVTQVTYPCATKSPISASSAFAVITLKKYILVIFAVESSAIALYASMARYFGKHLATSSSRKRKLPAPTNVHVETQKWPNIDSGLHKYGFKMVNYCFEAEFFVSTNFFGFFIGHA